MEDSGGHHYPAAQSTLVATSEPMNTLSRHKYTIGTRPSEERSSRERLACGVAVLDEKTDDLVIAAASK